MVEIVETKELSGENLFHAMEQACFAGEKFVLRVGEVEVGIVPVEDIETQEIVKEIGE
ncbi:MAG: hypothetical protein AAF443_04320 [Chlamydiota bacterium]